MVESVLYQFDFLSCANTELLASEELISLVRQLLGEAGLAVVGDGYHMIYEPINEGDPAGQFLVVPIAESHVIVNTWPEVNAALVDVECCNITTVNIGKVYDFVARLESFLRPMEVVPYEPRLRVVRRSRLEKSLRA